MIGELAPLVLAARFTSYLGPGIHSTAPLDVSAYDRAAFEFWRGSLAGTGADFKAFFEQADEPGPDPATTMGDPVSPWSNVITPITTPATNSLVTFNLTKRYLRLRIGLTGDEAAITLWAVGSLRKRVPMIA